MAMTKERIDNLVDYYEQRLALRYESSCGLEPARHLGEIYSAQGGGLTRPHAEHLLHSLHEIRSLNNDSARREKLMRWLGFVQGALWHAGVFCVADLMHHNRPDVAAPALHQVERAHVPGCPCCSPLVPDVVHTEVNFIMHPKRFGGPLEPDEVNFGVPMPKEIR